MNSMYKGLFGVLSASSSGIPTGVLNGLGLAHQIKGSPGLGWIELAKPGFPYFTHRLRGIWSIQQVLDPHELAGFICQIKRLSTYRGDDQLPPFESPNLSLGIIGEIENDDVVEWTPTTPKLSKLPQTFLNGFEFHRNLCGDTAESIRRVCKVLKGSHLGWLWARHEHELFLWSFQADLFYLFEGEMILFSSIQVDTQYIPFPRGVLRFDWEQFRFSLTSSFPEKEED